VAVGEDRGHEQIGASSAARDLTGDAQPRERARTRFAESSTCASRLIAVRQPLVSWFGLRPARSGAGLRPRRAPVQHSGCGVPAQHPPFPPALTGSGPALRIPSPGSTTKEVSPDTARARLLLVALLACGVYARSLGHDLVWDDLHLVELSRPGDRQGGLPAVLTAQFDFRSQRDLGLLRPVVLFFAVGELPVRSRRAVAYHLTNVLVHAAATVLSSCSSP